MPVFLDHLLAILLLAVWPAWIALRGPEEMKELSEHPEGRVRAYVTTMAFQWVHVLAIALLWLWQSRDLSALGFGFELRWEGALALALVLVAATLMVRQRQRVERDRSYRERIQEQVREVEGIVPGSPREVAAFRAMALTAGICEEIAYRGYLLWYLASFMPIAFAVPLTLVAFGASHLYQGVSGAAQVTVIGSLMMLLYLLSGSLWIPIVFHVAFDLHQLAIVRAASVAPATPEPSASQG